MRDRRYRIYFCKQCGKQLRDRYKGRRAEYCDTRCRKLYNSLNTKSDTIE